MSDSRFRVRVTKDHLVFSAAHFITFNGNICERLHGHNWRTAVELSGPLDENRYVFDFIALKNRMRELTDELDHRMLVATKNQLLAVTESAKGVRISFCEKEWVFPREDCVLLPIENTTVELLANYLAGRLLDVLKTQHRFSPDMLRIEVEESFGQVATYEWRK